MAPTQSVPRQGMECGSIIHAHAITDIHCDVLDGHELCNTNRMLIVSRGSVTSYVAN